MGRPMLKRPACIRCGAECNELNAKYCSRRCWSDEQVGIPRPMALGNQWAFRGTASGKWAHYKRMQKLCPSGPCTECGSTIQSTIHHKDHNPFNTVPSNLQRMCRSCHARHHHTIV